MENIEASQLNEPATTTEDISQKVESQALLGPDIKPVGTNQASEVDADESQEDDFWERNSIESEEDDLGFGDGGHESEEEELPGSDQQVAEMAADAEEEDDRAIAQAVVEKAEEEDAAEHGGAPLPDAYPVVGRLLRFFISFRS